MTDRGVATVVVQVPSRCDACGHMSRPSEMEQRVLACGPVVMCLDPVLCRRRCEVAGTWCTYPRPAVAHA